MKLAVAASLSLSLAACAAPPRAPSAPSPAAGDLAIRGVTVVDVESGALLADRTVHVRGKRIVSVDSGTRALPAGATVVDGAGKYLIPGLWDMHGHILHRWSWGAPLDVANGVTGVRDMSTSTPMAEVRRIRGEVAAGRRVGPRLVVAGPLIDGQDEGEPVMFPEYLAVSSVARARHVVDSLHAEGVDFIKVYTHLRRDLLDAIVERSRHHGLRFTGHVPLALTTAEASDLGMRSVEHAYRHRMACATAEDEIRRLLVEQLAAQRRRDAVANERLEDSTFRLGLDGYSSEKCRALGRRFARNGTWFVPSLVEMRSRYLPEPRSWEELDSLFRQPHLAYMPRAVVARWRDEDSYGRGARDRGITSREEYERMVADRAREVETRLRMVADLHRGGAGILAGTDASIYFPTVVIGFALHEELQLLVQAGLTPLQALQAATLSPARFLNATDSLGTVAPGKLADLVLLDANPLADIRHTTRIRGVVLDGRWLDRAALDALLDQARRAANPAP